MKQHIKIAASALAAAVASFLAGDASAYYHYGWASTFAMAYNTCSMPVGSDAEWAHYNSGDKWWNIKQVMDPYWSYPNCSIGSGNGVNQTAIVTRASIAGANGSTLCITTGTGFPLECDTKIASDVPLYAYDEAWWPSPPGGSATTMVHEHGHAIGMSHANVFNMMRTNAPQPMSGGNTHSAYPDEIIAMRSLYSGHPDGPGGVQNVFTTGQSFDGTNIVRNSGIGPVSVCRGGTFSMKYTVQNSGLSYQSVNFRFYLSNVSPSAASGILLWSGAANINPMTGFNGIPTFTVPNTTPNGAYWVLYDLDSSGALAEYDEGDNRVHAAFYINVTC